MAVTTIGSRLITDLGVQTNDLANGAVTVAKLGALTTKGDLLGFDSAHNRLAVGTDGQMLVADSSQTLGVKWSTPQANRNLLINGDFAIWQRGTSFTSITTTLNKVTADRWRVQNGQSSATVSAVQDTSTPATNNAFSLKVTATTGAAAAAADNIFFEQVVEGYNFRRIAGKTFTFSIWVKASKTGTMGIAFLNNDASRSYASSLVVNAANTWEQKTFTVLHDTTGTWNYANSCGIRIRIGMLVGSNYTTGTPNTWQSANLLGPTSPTNFLSTTSDTVQFAAAQLEIGSVATTFDTRDFATELLQCQRYYHQTYLPTVAPGTVTAVGAYRYRAQDANPENATTSKYPAEMRVTPTLVFYSPTTGTAGRVRDLSGSADVVTGGVVDAGASSHSGQNFTHTTSRVYQYHYTADADAF